MPKLPYNLDGIVYDVDGVTGKANVTVTALNSTTGEELPSNAQGTTSSTGEYAIDLGNFTSGVSHGDVVVVYAYYTHATESTSKKEVSHKTVVAIGDGGETINLTLTYYDPLNLILELLIDNWQRGRTDNVTPIIKKVFDRKRIMVMTDTNSAVLVYEQRTMQETMGLGVNPRMLRTPISIDIRVANTDRSRAIKMLREVDRIVAGNMKLSISGWNILNPDRGWVDLSDKSIKLWRYVYDVYLEKHGETRPT